MIPIIASPCVHRLIAPMLLQAECQ
jgi:hypothetical protein